MNYPLLNLISLPAQTVGKMSVVREPYIPGREFTVISMRTSFVTGQKLAKTIASRSGTIHKLHEKGQGIWMSDLPCEIYQHAEFVPNLRGHVLIGGLGLGLILKMLERNPAIESVTVIEKNKDVISLVWKGLKLKYPAKIINADLFAFLKRAKRGKKQFDSAYYDIWTADSGWVYYEYIEPLRKLSKGIIEQENIYCWQEDVISSQKYK